MPAKIKKKPKRVKKPVPPPLKVDPIRHVLLSDPPITEPAWVVDYGFAASEWKRGLFESREHAERFVELRLKRKASYTKPMMVGLPRETYSESYIVKMLKRDQEQRAEAILRQELENRTPLVRSKPAFDLEAILSTFPPLPRFQWGTDAEGIAAGFLQSPENLRKMGRLLPDLLTGKGKPPTPPEKRTGATVLSEKTALPIPLPAGKAESLPTVEREGKKPKIVLCGQRFGLSYIFLWMGRAGWSHEDLERFCDKLKIELPSINTTQSRLRAGRNKDSLSYGTIPKLSKKQEELMSNTVKGRK